MISNSEKARRIKCLTSRLRDQRSPDVRLDQSIVDVLAIDVSRSGKNGAMPVRRYTRNLESAAWVVKVQLPNWRWSLYSCDEAGRYKAKVYSAALGDFESSGFLPSIALLRAVLHAEYAIAKALATAPAETQKPETGESR